MWKFIKWALLSLLGLILLGIGALIIDVNSEKLSSDMVFLKCGLPNNYGGTADKTSIEAFMKNQRTELIGRLRKDWIKGKVLLNWVSTSGETESGLGSTKKLSISTDRYSGYSYFEDTQRTFNRETLVYTLEQKKYNEEAQVWLQRNCTKTTKAIFERVRKKSADATKAKQKI